MTYDGRPVVLIRAGIFQCLVEYRDLFVSLPVMTRPGDCTSRRFRVLTNVLEEENDVCLTIGLL
jgi:hypothetical protein